MSPKVLSPLTHSIMPITVVPAAPANLTAGEKRILSSVRDLYGNQSTEAFLYVQPRLRNQEPDFLILDPDRGACVLEVKDWGRSTIRSINRTRVQLNNDSTTENPAFQTVRYHKLLEGLFESEPALYDHQGESSIRVHSRLLFSRLRADQAADLQEVLDFHPTKVLFLESLGDLSLEDFFGQDLTPITQNQLRAARSTLFPEILIRHQAKTQETHSLQEESESEQIIKALDAEQETFAKALPEGHYMVSGVPGSGKTVILISRALFFAKKNPHWKILVVTYNKSLKSKLEESIAAKEQELSFMGISTSNIEIRTFHSLALTLSNLRVPQNPSDEFWTDVLPEAALERATPQYDAVLIDEYQDFRESWIQVCQKVAKTHTSGEDGRQCIFLAGDRLQSIYNPKELVWKDLNIQIQGGNRSKLLKHSYRSGKAHITIALDYLTMFPNLASEVDKFYEGRQGIDNVSGIHDRIGLLTGDAKSIAKHIDELVLKGGVQAKDILVLVPKWKVGHAICHRLSPEVKSKAQVQKQVDETRLCITTYHSAKGLERPTCILAYIDSVEDPKLLYVGMTRASESLYLHSSNDFLGGTSAQIKTLLNTYADA